MGGVNVASQAVNVTRALAGSRRATLRLPWSINVDKLADARGRATLASREGPRR